MAHFTKRQTFGTLGHGSKMHRFLSRLLPCSYSYHPSDLSLSLVIHDLLWTHIMLFLYVVLQLWRSFYTIVMMVLAFASLFAQTHSQFLSNHWYMRRLVLYSAFFFAGIVPVVHWVVNNGGFSDPLVKVSNMMSAVQHHDLTKVSYYSSSSCPRFL